MQLRKPLPKNRSFQQVLNHYQVEKKLATSLKNADKAKRKEIYKNMYDELFEKVPDHPRLTKRDNKTLSALKVGHQMAFLKRFISIDKTVVEFASGDGMLLKAIAGTCKEAIGIDISDQRKPNEVFPGNAKLVIYDGYDLKQINDNFADIVFSDQLIEHLHNEDVLNHFGLVKRILKTGGLYAFRTPHAFCGPHDISQYFSDTPEGFHLKEWTYKDADKLLECGFKNIHFYWSAKNIYLRVPRLYFSFAELIFKNAKSYRIRKIAQFFLPSVTCVLIK